MVLKGYSTYEVVHANDHHAQIGKQIMGFVNDCGEDCDVILEFDDPDGSFQYLFTGTNLALEFDRDAISVIEFNFANNTEETLALFNSSNLNQATHWLLTQANHQNTSS